MNSHEQDQLVRFLLPDAGVRGVCVHLGETWRQICGGGDYPPAVREFLGEASAAAALFTGHAKVDGRLSVQLRGSGALRTLFVECTAAGTLRGIAQCDTDAAISRDLRALGPDALLAITIENPGRGQREPMRYQGLVPIESDALSEAFESYFDRSEQLPTRLLLAAGDGAAAGLMLQKIPEAAGDADGWNRACLLFDTVRPGELLELPAATLLLRLFHQEAVEILGEKALAFACSCSRDRVTSMLESLGKAEARAALIDGQASVRCEFCGQTYLYTAADIDALFTRPSSSLPGPTGLQ